MRALTGWLARRCSEVTITPHVDCETNVFVGRSFDGGGDNS